MTQAQRNLESELYRAIRDGINEAAADILTRGGPNESTSLVKNREILTDRIVSRLRHSFRIGRPRRKQTELNP